MSLADASKEDVGKVGGKAANLGELIDKGFPVPGGFVSHHECLHTLR